jgi:hypothetical protein
MPTGLIDCNLHCSSFLFLAQFCWELLVMVHLYPDAVPYQDAELYTILRYNISSSMLLTVSGRTQLYAIYCDSTQRLHTHNPLASLHNLSPRTLTQSTPTHSTPPARRPGTVSMYSKYFIISHRAYTPFTNSSAFCEAPALCTTV